MTTLAAIDPGRSKCGLVLAEPSQALVLEAGVLPPDRCRALVEHWRKRQACRGVVLGNGTGSAPWRDWLTQLDLQLIVVPEAGTTLAARERYWQLEPARSWRRLLPQGLRLPPRDVDDVVAQILLERHLGQVLRRRADQQLLLP
jgi:hypothetical protein